MTDKTKAFLFRLTYFFIFVGQAMGYCLLVSYLTQIGYSATERSIMFASGAAVSIICSILLGYLFDRTKAIKKYSYPILIAYALAAVLIYINNSYNFAYHLIMVMIFRMLFSVSVGVFDSWCMEISDYMRTRYGIIRAYGSIGWAFGCFIAPYCIDLWGWMGLPIGVVVSTIVTFLFYFKVDDAAKNSSSEKIKFSDIGKLITNKSYLYLVLALLGAFLMLNSTEYAVVDKINLLGGNESDVSLFWSIAAIMELPFFFVANKITDKIGAIKVFCIANAIYMLRFVIYAVSSNVDFIVYSSILQGLCYPLVMYVSKEIVMREAPSNLQSSAMQVGMAIYSQFSALVAPLLVGIVEDNFSINTAIMVVTCSGIFAFLFIFLYRKTKKS